MNITRFSVLICALLLTTGAASAGTLTYVPIPAPGSDQNSGVMPEHGYTTAVDGGNTANTPRVLNEIQLDALVGSGDSVSADNCTLTALSGTLTNASGAVSPVAADGVLGEALTDMTSVNGAEDASQQEIVLDPESLTAGTTYDLRIYIRSSSGHAREVNLAFVGDGLAAAETGYFDEDDARTSPGGFTDENQVYYVNYRFTWDGDSTPGVTITQKSGEAPFVLYALTNEVVPGTAVSDTAAADSNDDSLTTGLVSAASDQVGVTSDTFYEDETLNRNGRWVNVGSYGACWQPTNVARDWRPYSNGSWRYADDGGWTWVTDEDWGAATYHYGRWARVEDVGWCWVPGTVWAGAWVSWRRGNTPNHEYVGWAPLPPEAAYDVNIGVSTWADNTYDIGPDAYSFVNVGDFGQGSYSNCGCILDRGSYVNIYEHTENITNITYVNNTYVNIYVGGPDYNWVNTRIRQRGGREIGKIRVNRVAGGGQLKNGKHSQLQGDVLLLAAPTVKRNGRPNHAPKIAANVPANKIDRGWSSVKDPAKKQQLKQKIADQNKGNTPVTTHAKLPAEVAQRIGNATAPGGEQKSVGAAKHPGKDALNQHAEPFPAGAKSNGGKGKRPAKAAAAAARASGQNAAGAAGVSEPGGKGPRPGQPNKTKTGAGVQPDISGSGSIADGKVAGGVKKRRPGDSLKHPKGNSPQSAAQPPVAHAGDASGADLTKADERGKKGSPAKRGGAATPGPNPAPVPENPSPAPNVGNDSRPAVPPKVDPQPVPPQIENRPPERKPAASRPNAQTANGNHNKQKHLNQAPIAPAQPLQQSEPEPQPTPPVMRQQKQAQQQQQSNAARLQKEAAQQENARRQQAAEQAQRQQMRQQQQAQAAREKQEANQQAKARQQQAAQQAQQQQQLNRQQQMQEQAKLQQLRAQQPQAAPVQQQQPSPARQQPENKQKNGGGKKKNQQPIPSPTPT